MILRSARLRPPAAVVVQVRRLDWVLPERPVPRILSLIASATEIVCALGYRDQLVGRSHECDYPPEVRALPQATAPRFDVSLSSREIDGEVKKLAREAEALDALGVYEVRADALRDLEPTHIVTQSQCDVCAVSERDVELAVARTTGCSSEIVSLQPNTLADVWSDILRVAAALGDEARGLGLTESLQDRMNAVARSARSLPDRPGVAVIEWIDPLMAAGNWMPELVAMAGGRCLFGRAGEHSPWMTFDDLVAADPDVIMLSPCGFGIGRTLEDVPLLRARAGWESLRAVRAGRVFVADGNQFFNRPGPRLAESLEILAEILHPGRFGFGHRGTGWIPVPDRAPD